MPDLLFELFSEEIPARMQRQAAEDLKRLVTGTLVDAGVTYEGAKSIATPRRLALNIVGLPARQPDTREEKKGPRVGAPEAAVQGFLKSAGLMLNLILMVFTTAKNKENTERTIKELTIISEITLLGGLFMVSVGTYLGGVWANESWGRYWGWDAKETWALVTILVYAFILHMRFIPGLRSVYAFNFASLFGFATVIMTYFGVNYYLSGLHSFAAGDPVPVPPQVYYTAIALAILSIVAFVRWRKVQ